MADFMFYQPTRIDFGAGKLEKAGESVNPMDFIDAE